MERAISRRNWLLAVLLALVLPFGTALAQTETPESPEPTVAISDFVGNWQGMGVLETEDSLFFAMNRRDLDVTIDGDDRRFTVEWTTVRRSGDDPDAPEIRRESASLTFSSADHPHVYEASSSESPLDGGTMSWARLHGQTLSVYQMAITEGGGYAVSTYDRTLLDGGDMALRFVRLEDGEPVREVNGQLSRVSP